MEDPKNGNIEWNGTPEQFFTIMRNAHASKRYEEALKVRDYLSQALRLLDRVHGLDWDDDFQEEYEKLMGETKEYR